MYIDLRNFCYKVTAFVRKADYFQHSFDRRNAAIKKEMKQISKEGVGKDLFIVLNGPSLKNQDLSKLKGKNVMFVNRGFLHPLYKELQPQYHIFVDPKMLTGVWPLEWIDQIFDMCPNIRIIFPISWYTHPHIRPIRDDKRIFWQYEVIPFHLIGVSARAISYGVTQGFKNIFFTGFDANSCAYDMIKSSQSHFYGADPELKEMSIKQHMSALYTTYLEFYDLIELSKYCIKRGINIYNLTDGGILDMFTRRDFNDPYNKEKEIPIKSDILR